MPREDVPPTRSDDPDDDSLQSFAEIPEPSRDPRLEIPDVLRRPVEKPASLLKGEAARRGEQSASGAGSKGDLARALGLAGDFVGSVAGGIVIGYVIDRWRNSLPIGTLIGLALGFLTAMVRMVRYSMRAEREAQRKRGS